MTVSEGEEEMSASGIRCQPGIMRRCNQLNFRTLEPESRLGSQRSTVQVSSSAGDTDMYLVRAWRSDE